MRWRVNRRRGLALLSATIVLLFSACTPDQRPSESAVEPTPTPNIQSPPTAKIATVEPTRAAPDSPAIACVPPAEPSPAMTEGPYFKVGSPERASLLEASTAGEMLVVSGHVVSIRCEPLAGATLDFWQTDGNGIYDNEGYALRGHQFTDAAGRYELTTVVPGIYPGRTAHIHVKVAAPGLPTLTTQLFFPGQANETDRIFDERLLIDLQPAARGWNGRFDFVLAGQ